MQDQRLQKAQAELQRLEAVYTKRVADLEASRKHAAAALAQLRASGPATEEVAPAPAKAPPDRLANAVYLLDLIKPALKDKDKAMIHYLL